MQKKNSKCVEKEPVEPGGTRGGTGWIAKGCKELKESGRELKADRFRLKLQTSGLLGGINAEIHLTRKSVEDSRAILATRLGQRSAAECE